MHALTIDAMQAGDWPDVRVIYEEGIATGLATFERSAPSWDAWDRSHRRECRLVARDSDDVVMGWAALSHYSARAVYADHEAVEHYRRARDFLRRLDDPVRERETLFKIALVRHLAFDYARAGQAYDAAFDCSTEERTARVATPETLVLSLVRPDSYAPGDTYSSESAIVIEQGFSQ